MATDEYPPFVPMPSLRNELGVMFGFFSLCIVVMGAYVALWRRYQTRLDAQDLAHRKSLRNKSQTQPLLGTTTSVTAGRSPNPSNDTTTSKTKASVQERMLDYISMPENRAELPVHGMEMYAPRKGNAITSHIRCPFSRSTPLSSASPVGGGIAAESIVGMTLEGGRSLNQCLLRVDGFRSASPARRFGGGSGPAVEIGPAPSRE
ncbi:hypothetical protein PEX1_034920 [Penicillium expansum]|uniref:Uncharacterized protein n=1 Tax=Penicillium expansum TaxID=27334 RepID=A0A0A2HZ70_PENEN|nr:hypothetical protein PEX2_084850 [Penicillium expansum]KGO36282.1 hypothetical protein PEXP_103490 [Penicillium expansum]KGO58046.1 hypothetical protein PEX2_084850 [Penicillium expansum]KGO68672.1 hypothetical protein PEX1_034920 [Penicillium expansum]